MNWINILGLISAGLLFWIVVFKEESLHTKKGLINYLLVFVPIFILGILMKSNFVEDRFNFAYYLTQAPLIFILLYYPLRILSKSFGNHDPKISGISKFSDLIYTMILFGGTFLLPILIDYYIVK